MKKWLLWVVLTGVGLAAIIVVAVVFLTRPHKPVPLSPAQLQTLQYTVPQLTTNLSDNSMIQTTVVLQTNSAQTLDDLNVSAAQINNAVIGVFNNTSGAQIDAPNGLTFLKNQIINAISKYGKISAVYFTQLIIQ